MLRRRFLINGVVETPDFTITYYAPQHIPFLHTYKRLLYSVNPSADTEYMTFNVVLDTWNDGVGTYGIKITNDVLVWYNFWTNDVKQTNLETFLYGCLGACESPNSVNYDYTNTITDVIFSNGIQHLECPIVPWQPRVNTSIVNVTLPNDLHTLGDRVFEGLKALRQIDIPASVVKIGNNIASIGFANDVITNTERTNTSLQEIVLRPTTPPIASSTSPINIINKNAINSDFKIKVYADCIDTYKNTAIWSLYNDLYDTVNNSIVYYIGDTRYVEPYNSDIEVIRESNVPPQATKIYLPNSVTTIESAAFYYCNNLTFINIPKKITDIGDLAFIQCSMLTSIVIDSEAILNNGYSETSSISNVFGTQVTEYSIGNHITSIPSYVFSNCTNLNTINIGLNVTSIQYSAFTGCTSLTSLYFNAINCLTCSAFAGSTSIESVVIGNSVKRIPSSLCSDISNITSITIPESVTEIGLNSFRECSSLTSVVIPNSVTKIGDWAFKDCKRLTDITIPDSVTNIGNRVFEGCESVVSPIYSQWLFVYMPKTYTESYVIPDGITNIMGYAFNDNKNITSIILPDSVTSIAAYAFSGCSSLTSIMLGNGVTSIGESAFLDCDAINSMVIPENVTSVGASAFHLPNLTSIVWNAKNCADFKKDSFDVVRTPFGPSSRPSYITSFTFGKSVEYIPVYLCYTTELTEIRYEGTISEWNTIQKGDNWYPYTLNIVHCTDGDVEI